MKVTVVDSEGTKTLTRNLHYSMKPVLGLASRRGYGWAIKPDVRQKRQKTVKPKIHFVLSMVDTPQVGMPVIVTYQSEF